MRAVLPWLVEWWYERLWREKEARAIAHQERLVSAEIMAMYNKPQSVVNLQALRDQTLAILGVK